MHSVDNAEANYEGAVALLQMYERKQETRRFVQINSFESGQSHVDNIKTQGVLSRCPKGLHEISQETVAYLLQLMMNEKYKKLNNKNKINYSWNKLYLELIQKGHEIPGADKDEQMRKLFQKWRNLKRKALQYESTLSFKTKSRMPPHYNLIKQIIDEENKNKIIIKSETPDQLGGDIPAQPADHVIQLFDHDYRVVAPIEIQQECYNFNEEADYVCAGESIKSSEDTDNSIDLNLNEGDKQTSVSCDVSSKPNCINCNCDATKFLQEIKNLHETALENQTAAFGKMVSLLEEQNRNQRLLNEMILQYLNKRSSKH